MIQLIGILLVVLSFPFIIFGNSKKVEGTAWLFTTIGMTIQGIWFLFNGHIILGIVGIILAIMDFFGFLGVTSKR